MKVNKPELLAPAGNFNALKAAVENGADAVYLGGKEFNARRGANNFDRKQLLEALDYAHLKGVNIYVTVNILLSDQELRAAAEFIDFLYVSGADGIIVQDLGLAHFIKSNFKDMELHASTQMTIHNVESAQMLKNLNFDRIVLARELSLEDIGEIKSKVGLKIETFIHGALCICYSGQCLMSSFIGGRSGNRGQCAQPCRLPYTLINERKKPVSVKAHFLSPRDLCMIEHIPYLIKAGIDSFKIEGRLKRPEYVAQVTRIYREVIDRFMEAPDRFMVSPEEIKRLLQVFNRDFTTGYFFGNPGSALMSIESPKNKGIFVGKVLDYNYQNHRIKVKLEEPLREGDGVRFKGTDDLGLVVTKMYKNGNIITEAKPGQIIELNAKKFIPKGTVIYKTADFQLNKESAESYKNPRLEKKMPVDFYVTAKIGYPVIIKAIDIDGNTGVAKSEFIVEHAVKKPLDVATLKAQIDRLGETVFKLRNFHADIDDNIMMPFSVINDLRRTVIYKLQSKRIKRYDRSNKTTNCLEFLAQYMKVVRPVPNQTDVKLSVRSNTLDAALAAESAGADIIYFGSDNLSELELYYKDVYTTLSKRDVSIYMVFPRIIKPDDMPKALSLLEKMKLEGIQGVVAGNLGILSESVKLGFNVIADFSLNVFNSVSLHLLKKLGAQRMILSPELTLKQIEVLSGDVEKEVIVHGRLPLMFSEHDIRDFDNASKVQVVGIRDRLGKVFPITFDEHNRTQIYNSDELCMINHLNSIKQAGVSVMELYLNNTAPDRVNYIVASYKDVLQGKRSVDENEITKNFTHGHYFRGVV